MSNMLEGKVALITGAARGQGAEEARLFISEGARVMIADIREEEGEKLAGDLGPSAHFTRLDVTNEEDWSKAVTLTQEVFGGLDILVNNAGLYEVRPLAEYDVESYMRVIRVNQLGGFLGMRAAAPAMKARGGGSIVNTSSVLGLVAAPNTMAYTASKFALRGMTKVAALELAGDGVRVNSVHPGLIKTDMVRDQTSNEVLNKKVRAIPMKRMGTGQDVAQVALFLASDRSAYCTGSEFVCDGGNTIGVYDAE